MTYPVGVKGEGLGENLKNIAQNVGVGMYKTIAHPIDTATGLLKSVTPAPVEQKVFGTQTPNPIEGAYQAAQNPGEQGAQALGQAIVTAGALKGYGALRAGLAAKLGRGATPAATPAPEAAPTTATPSTPEAVAPSPAPEQPGGPGGPAAPAGGGPTGEGGPSGTKPSIGSQQPRVQMGGAQGAPDQTGKPTITLEQQPSTQGAPTQGGGEPPKPPTTAEMGPLIGDEVMLPDGRSGRVTNIEGGTVEDDAELPHRTRTVLLNDGTKVEGVAAGDLLNTSTLLDDIIDQGRFGDSAASRLRPKFAGKSPAQIAATRAKVEAAGTAAHDAGDIGTATKAAYADIALGQLAAAAAALTGKSISEVSNAKGGDIFDQIAGGKGEEQRPVVQGSTNPEEIHQSAEEQKPVLKDMAQQAAAGVPGAKVEGVRVKAPEAVDNKEERGKPPETITDHLGARVSAPTPEAVAQVKQNVESQLPVQSADKITNNGINADQYAVQTGKPGEANQQSELQVVTTDQAKAMKDTDGLYDKQKEAMARGDQAEADRIGDQIKAHFEQAKLKQQFDKHGIVNTRTPEEQQKLSESDIKSRPVQVAKNLHYLSTLSPEGADQAKQTLENASDAVRAAYAALAENQHGNDSGSASGNVPSTQPEGSKGLPETGRPPREGGSGSTSNEPSTPAASQGGSAAPSEVKPFTPAKGARVQLQDGKLATVTHYDPKRQVAGIKRDDGRVFPVVPVKSLSPAPEEKASGHVDTEPIGKPIPSRVEQIKQEIAKGTDVRIFSARVANDPEGKARAEIEQWSEKNLGKKLPVTNEKDDDLAHFLDDKANVTPNANEPFDIPAIPKGKWLGVDLDKTIAFDKHAQPEGNHAGSNESGNGGKPSAATETKGGREETDAVQKPSTEGILQREPKENGSAGSERGRVEPEQQGNEPARESAKPAGEAKPLEQQTGGEGKKEEVKRVIPPSGEAEDNARKVQPLSSYTVKPSKSIDKDRVRYFEGSDWISDTFMGLDLMVLDPGARRRIDKYLPTDNRAKYNPDIKKVLDGYLNAAETEVESVGWANISLGKDRKGKEMPPIDLALFADKKGNVYPFDPSKAKTLIDLVKPDAMKVGEVDNNKNPTLVLFKKGKPIAILMGLYTGGRIRFDADTARRILGQAKPGQAKPSFYKPATPQVAPVKDESTVAKEPEQAENKEEEATNEPKPASASEHPAGGRRPSSDTGGGDREGVAESPEGNGANPPREGGTATGDQGEGPRLRSGSSRRAKPRTEPGSGAGANESLDSAPGLETVEQAEEKANKPTKRNKNWYEHPEDWQVSGGPLARLDNNIAALEILRDVEKNPRKITDDEKAKLANYVGWGALSRVFDENYLEKSDEEEHPEHYGAKEGYDYNARRWLAQRKETPEYKRERERWRAANKKLRELLTPDEYNEAKDSTINAHYTSPELVRFMWDAVKRMGFKSGNVLEPSMGVGNFFGMMPPEIRSKVQAVGNDKDTVTTGIAKLLYPEAAIFNKPFEDLILPNNEMDLAISNVPFFEVPVYDKNYPKMKAMLHDYFFVKSLDKVKPGGLVAFITSTGTMDRQRSDIREALAGQADLVSAFRLPSTAFKANAGTDVTTDLIILRKRLPGEEPGGEAWMKATPTKVPIEDDRRKLHELTVNEYYQAHPENMLGTAVASKKMYNNLRFTLNKPERPIDELLKEALERLPKNIVKTAPKPAGVTQADTEAVFAADETLEYSYQVDDKGRIRQKREGKLVPAQAVIDKNGLPQPAKVERMKALIRLRQSLNDLMYHMKTLPDDEESNHQIKVLREALKKQYDGFVKKYGLLNSVGNNVFREDPHYPRLLALENFDKAKKAATPADIFQKRTIYPRQSLTSISQDPGEALQQILAERGYPDVDLMAQLQGKTPKEAAESLIKARVLFRDPITGGYETKERYLSGYVRTKLDDAKAAVAQGQNEYKANVEELEKIQPEFVHITDDPKTSISVRLGGTWIPVPALEQFFKDTFKTRGTFTYTEGTWAVEAENSRTPEITNQWATRRVDAVTLLQDSLNLKQTTIYDVDSEGKSHLNADETTAARAMQERMRQEFQKWALESKEWKEPLEKAYNYAFNNLAETEYDGSFLTFPGMNPEIQLKAHQVNAVWRMIQDGRALLAHEVGAGKTFEMVAAVMEGKRTGVFKKPMIAVPNHIVDQFRKEFLLLYPGANILVPSEKDFDAKNRQRIMSQIATGDYDCIILPHSQFNLMDISPERQKKTIQGEMDELDEAIRGAIQEDPEFKGLSIEEAEAKVEREAGKGGRKKASTVKELVKSRLKFKERLKELSDLKADKAINFDDTGVDALFIDEAHEYKNLKYFTKMQRISGLQQANSKRSFRLLAKLQYLQEVNNGRGVFFATGTPVQNTMAELYTMMKYVAPDVLERAGIKYFDDWAANFGSVITAMELSADGRSFKARSKFARFQNVPELMRMFRAFADVKTAADLNLPRPELEGGKPIVITVPGSEKLDEVVKDLMERAEDVRGGHVRPDEDNMLKITSEGRKAATDLRLLDNEIKDEQESKINIAVKQMLKEYRAGQEDKLTQMAFLDMYRSMDEKENELINLYKDMKAKLVAGGVPENEIAIIGDYNTRAKRQALFEMMNAGTVRILLGSTQKMGAGTNAQRRLKALHHIDLTWRPGDLTQREGRILRQGNTNKSVRIYNYLTERSFDAYMAQTLQSKAEFLSQMLSGRSTSRIVTDAAADMVLSLEEMKVAASGNPDIKLKYDLEMRLAQLQTVERAFEASKRDAHFQVRNIESAIKRAKDEIKRLEKSQATIAKVKGSDGEGYSMEVDGKKFTERKAAMEYIKAMQMPAVRFYMKVNGVEAAVDPTGTIKEYDPQAPLTKQEAMREGRATGKYVDVPSVAYDLEFEETSAHFHNNRVPNFTMESVALSIEARLRAIPNLIERDVQAIKDGEDQKLQFEKLADRKDFPERKELEKTRAELAEVEKRLGLGNVNQGSQADKEETAAEVDTSKEPEIEDKEEEESDDDEEDGPDVTRGDTPPTKPEPPSDLGSTFYAGFADPALFARLFPDVAGKVAEWVSDNPTPADDQRGMMRETRGQMDRRVAIAMFKLRDASKEWRSRPRQDSIDFWNAVENGRIASLSPKDQALAQVFKAAFDSMRQQLQTVKPEALQNYIENYFPHIWERQSHVRSAIKGLLTGKKPFAGKGGFLKRRTIPTMQDGLDLGFTPKSWNPVDSFLMKYAEMAQFLMAHQTLQVMKDAGTAKFVKVGQKAPDGFTQLDDRIGTVYRRVKVLDEDKLEDVTQPLTYPGGKRKYPGAFSEDIEDATHGETALVGHYYAPADAAKVFNHFVSRGIAGRSSIYDTLRWINDNLNGLQLGISAFHATVTTLNAAASDIALGIEQLSQGKLPDFGKSFLSGAAVLPALFRTIRNGSRLTREYLNPGSYTKMAKEADAMAQAGGRIKQNTLELKPFDKAVNAFRNGAVWEGLSAVPGAILQGMVAPVMEYYVPKMKVGAFYQMAHNVLDEADRKNWTPDVTRARMQEAWDSVDDRFGQIVYENLFWHKGLRDAFHLMTRSVGYTFGDIRTYAGAVGDTAKAAAQITKGKKPRVTPRMAFAVASFMSTALLGGVMTFLGTGHAPQSWKDYYYPQDSAGIRHTMPGYPDQIVQFFHDPERSTLNKAAPIWGAFGEAINNRDFYGTEIRHKDDPAMQQLIDVSEWAGKQAIPFSFTNAGKLLEDSGAQQNLGSMLHEAVKHPGDIALGQLGFTAAPSWIRNSEALNKAREYQRENRPPGTRTKEQAERSRIMHQMEDMYRSGKVDKDMIRELKHEGKISETDVLKARLYSRTDPLVRTFKSLSPEQALNVWKVANDKERKELRPILEGKSRELTNKITDPAKREKLRQAFHEALHPQPQFRPGSA